MTVFLSKFSRYFKEVAAHRSIRRASDRLNVAASAIDRQILNYEHASGTKLFDRLPGGLRLTAVGEVVSRYVARWTREEAAMLREIEAISSGGGGVVRIAVADGLALGFIPEIVVRLSRSHPKMRFEVKVATAAEAASSVRSSQYDLALTFDPPSFAGLSVLRETISHLGVLMPRDHPLSAHAPLHLAACAGCRLVVPDASTALWPVIERLWLDIAAVPDIVFRSNNIGLISHMVELGLGIAFMRDLDVIGMHHSQALAFVALSGVESSDQRLSLIAASDRPLASSAALVAEEISIAFDTLERRHD